MENEDDLVHSYSMEEISRIGDEGLQPKKAQGPKQEKTLPAPEPIAAPAKMPASTPPKKGAISDDFKALLVVAGVLLAAWLFVYPWYKCWVLDDEVKDLQKRVKSLENDMDNLRHVLGGR